MRLKQLLLAIILCAATVVAIVPVTADAASPVTNVAVCAKDTKDNFFGFQPWYACLQKKYNGDIKLKSLNDLFLVIFPTVEAFIKAAAFIASGMIFYMLFRLVRARANPSKVETAINGMRDAVIGFIICLASIAIVNFIAGAFIPKS